MFGPLLGLLVIVAGALAWLAYEVHKVGGQVQQILDSGVGRALVG